MTIYPIKRTLDAAVANGLLTPEQAVEIERKAIAIDETLRDSGASTTVLVSKQNRPLEFELDIDSIKQRCRNLDSNDVPGFVSIAIEVRDQLKQAWEAGQNSGSVHLHVEDQDLAAAFDFFRSLDGGVEPPTHVAAIFILKQCRLIDRTRLREFLNATGTAEQDVVNAQQAFRFALSTGRSKDTLVPKL